MSSSNSHAVLLAAAKYLLDKSEESYVNPHERETEECTLSLLRYLDSQTQKRTYKYRSRALYAEFLYKDYFSDNCVFSDIDFRRRFRMRRSLFLRIIEALKNYNPYFTQQADGLGKPDHDPLCKVVVVFRMLSYVTSADHQDEHFRIGKTTVLEAVGEFCDSMKNIFGEEYTRHPTAYDLERLILENIRRGFPGMIGSVDCMHWVWKNCPSAWAGQFTGHYSKPTIILEVVASYDTWFWHSFFGMPGSNNDLNVLQRSNLFEQLHLGIAPCTNFMLNGNHYEYRYYLADGIYPKYATIVQGFLQLDTLPKRRFTSFQDAARKDVERAFGILQSHFAIVAQPAKHREKESLAKIMKTCVIMHNMIVEDERRDGPWNGGYDHNGRNAPPVVPDRIYTRYASRRADTESENIYHRLREDLVQYIWNVHPGAEPDEM